MEEISFIVSVDSGSCQELLDVIRGVCPGVDIASSTFDADIGDGNPTLIGGGRRLTFKVQDFRHDTVLNAMTKAFEGRPKGSYAIRIRSGRYL